MRQEKTLSPREQDSTVSLEVQMYIAQQDAVSFYSLHEQDNAYSLKEQLKIAQQDVGRCLIPFTTGAIHCQRIEKPP
jgi:hypothetical protein